MLQNQNILSFDGGGVKGLFQCKIMEMIEKEFLLLRNADIITGTSTGAIIAVGLGLDKTPNELYNLYQKHSSEIFGNLSYKRMIFKGHKHNSQNLIKHLKDLFQDKKLNQCKKRVLIPTISLDHHEPTLFDSKTADDDVKAIDVVLASTAAPTYLPPHIIGSRTFLDGGLWANNPSLVALREMKCNHLNAKLLSIGCGHANYITKLHKSKSKILKMFLKMNLINWSMESFKILTKINTEVTHKHCIYLLNERYKRIDADITPGIDLDNYKEALEVLPAKADQVWGNEKKELGKWIDDNWR